MTWLKLAAGLIAIVQWLIGYLHDRKLIQQGERDAALKGLQEANESIETARAAREAVRSEHARNPDSVMSDDGFRRKD